MQGSHFLDAIGRKHGTDKSSAYHDYLNFYEKYFFSLRHEKLNILEIGIFHGASLRTWHEYFPNANIVGADINFLTKVFETNRVSVEILDQSDIEELTRMAVKHGPFDIVIDDGSHQWEHQITSLRTLFPFVKDRGIYIVEDLQSNYGAMEAAYRGTATISCVEYLKKWLDLLVGDNQVDITKVEDAFLRTYGRAVDSINFYHRSCLILKRFVAHNRMHNVVQPNVSGLPLLRDDASPRVKVYVIAHVSAKGDILGPIGFVNGRSDQDTFQGLLIGSAENLTQHRVLLQDRTWSEWTDSGLYAGTRGRSEVISGVAVRLRDEAKGRYLLRVICRFVDSADPVEAADGEDCQSLTGSPMCGFQILLTPAPNMSASANE